MFLFFGVTGGNINANVTNLGNIDLTGNSLPVNITNTVTVTGNVNATTSGTVVIQSLGAAINLGGIDTTANLGLSSGEINNITAVTISR